MACLLLETEFKYLNSILTSIKYTSSRGRIELNLSFKMEKNLLTDVVPL